MIKTYIETRYFDPKAVPFYVEDVSGQGGTINIYKRLGDATYVEYSTDKENWVRVDMGNSPYTPYANVPVTANNKVYIRATATKWAGSGTQNNGMIIQYNNDYNVGGNIMSMIYGQIFTNQKEFQENASQEIFQGFFTTESHLKKIDDLLLPATTLAQACYANMFGGCINLTAAPALPATTLAQACYGNMFSGCTALATAPALPATTLAQACYGDMFSGCTALATAPALPATTLAIECYTGMFSGCTALATAPALPATTLAKRCYQYMFQSCTSLTAAPALPATTLADSCYYMMFRNCTGLTAAPELPATNIPFYTENYEGMFSGCTSLSSVTVGATNWNANSTRDWLNNVSATGTFTKPSGTTIPEGVNGIPSGWAVINV